MLAVVSSVFASVFLLAFQSASRAAPRDAVVLAMLACAMVLNGGLVLARRKPRAPASRRATWLTIAVFAATTIGGNIGVAGALERLGPGITGTILQTQVFLVAVGGRLFLGEKVGPSFLAGAGLAFAGFVVLGLADPGQGRVDPAGVGFALLASACFGGMLLWTRAVIAKIEPVTVNVVRLVFAVAVMVLLPGRLGAALSLPSHVWLAIAIAAACGPFLSRLALLVRRRAPELASEADHPDQPRCSRSGSSGRSRDPAGGATGSPPARSSSAGCCSPSRSSAPPAA
ncbi:MAG: DMT family transporter [Sandaracinaceae bacterium]